MRNCLIPLLFCLTAFAGCNYDEGNKEIKLNGQYVINVPGYLSKTDRLAPDALAQYQNKFRSFYLVCAHEKKEGEKTLVNFTDQVIKAFSDQIIGLNIKKIEGIEEINGIPAQCHELTGTVSNKGIYYVLATVETSSHFYQICTWTLLSKKEQHEQVFYEVVGSFKKI